MRVQFPAPKCRFSRWMAPVAKIKSPRASGLKMQHSPLLQDGRWNLDRIRCALCFMFCLPGRDKAGGSVWGQPLAKGFQVFLPRRFSQADHLSRKCLPAAFQPLRMVQRFPCRNVVKIAVLEPIISTMRARLSVPTTRDGRPKLAMAKAPWTRFPMPKRAFE